MWFMWLLSLLPTSFFIASLLTVIAVYVVVKSRPSPELDQIPSIPFLDALKLILQKVTFEEYARLSNYYIAEPLRKIYMGGRWMVIATNPYHARKMLSNPDVFRKLSRDKYPRGLSHEFFGFNIVGVNGDLWKRYRKACNPAFNKLFPTQAFRELTLSMVQQWDKVIATGETIEVTDWLTRLTLDVLGRTVFDVPFNTLESKEARVVELYRYLMEGFFNVKYMMAPFLDKRWNPYRRPYFEACDEINAFFLDIIAKKKAQVKERLEKEARGEVVEQSKKDKDLLTLMYESFYDSEETEMFSDEEMRANLAVFFLAGHDTTSIALVSQIYYLALHPDVQQKAREEVLELLPTDESITPKTKLAYLEAVINECLRLHPPTSMMPFRLTEHESELEGADGHEMTIPENTVMTLDIKSVHRNPQVWQDPDEFRVERWLNTDDKTDKRLGYCPFGGGPRICIGMNFSLLEQRVVLSMLLRRYTWTLPKDTIHTDGIIRNHGILILKLEKMNVQFTPVK